MKIRLDLQTIEKQTNKQKKGAGSNGIGYLSPRGNILEILLSSYSVRRQCFLRMRKHWERKKPIE